MRPVRGQLIALLTAVAVLLSSGGFARTQFFCRMMNRVVATCCCASAAEHDDAACGIQVRATDCCERISTATRAPTLKPAATDVSVPAPVLLATIQESVYELPRVAPVEELPRQARGPPNIGPPLFIAHCRFLT